MRFKVGDKVKFVKNRPGAANNRDYLLGYIFTIEDQGPYPCTWKMKENNHYFFDEKELELVDGDEITPDKKGFDPEKVIHFLERCALKAAEMDSLEVSAAIVALAVLLRNESENFYFDTDNAEEVTK